MEANRPPGASRQVALAYLLMCLALGWVWWSTFGQVTHRTISYAAFKQHLAAGEVAHVKVGQDEIRGEISPALDAEHEDDLGAAPTQPFTFRAVRVEDPSLVDQLESAEVEFEGAKESRILEILLAWMLPMALLVAVWLFLMRRLGAGAGGQAAAVFGKSKAKLVAETAINVGFDDVAGCEEAKIELAEIVEFLQQPDRFTRIGATIPKGVLLTGPPGTGKTLLARAVAGEAEVPFFSLSGSDFVEMFVGVGAARVRDLFSEAKLHAPCIVFIDELDAIGRARGVHLSNINDEREHTLNQLLVEMDGFEDNSGVIILSATNRPDVLDPALLRPGRFDRQVVLDSPDVTGRQAILSVHARNKRLGQNVDLETIARETPGFAGADLANVMNEAALLAARRGADEIAQLDLEEAIEKVLAGPEKKSRRLEEEEKRRVAYHEAGHALVAIHSEHADPVHKISIVPRGRAALGYTLQLPTGDHYLLSRSALHDRIKGLLGGRAAEDIVLEDVSTGAENDLEQATATARRLVCQYGMGESAGLMHCARDDGPALLLGGGASIQRDCSEQTASAIDEEVKSLLAAAYDEARESLEAHRDQLDALASALLEHETLDQEAIRRLIE